MKLTFYDKFSFQISQICFIIVKYKLNRIALPDHEQSDVFYAHLICHLIAGNIQ